MAGTTRRPWTEREPFRSVHDLVVVLRFRASGVPHPGRARWAAGVLLLLTLAAAVVPALLDGAGDYDGRALDVAVVLPSALAAVVVLAAVSAAASGGGRELLSREATAVLPISPTTDHLGSLLLAPLNVAWLLQFWGLLGATAYAMGPHRLGAQLLVVLWMGVATATGQVLAWTLESVRRVPHGIAGVRLLSGVFFGVALGLQLSHELVALLDRLPTRQLVLAMQASNLERLLYVLGLAGVLLAVTALGAVPAHLAAHRLPRDEIRVETGTHPARRAARGAFATLVRLDRGSVWRSVTMRRGVLVLALGPGLVAVLGGLDWSTMTVLPGLVASGGALLYGVNAWCLDGRGALWRESLPVDAGVMFAARAYVLGEFLLAASGLTVLVAGVRAGWPDAAQLTALLCTLVVVTVQVVGAALRWSAARPFAVDLRTARATPAPPSVMVGYSVRLALTTTATGLLFAGLAGLQSPSLAIGAAVPCLIWSTARLVFTRREWLDPLVRARVTTTVAVA